MTRGILAAVGVLSAATLAQAGPLAPTRASQLVTLHSSVTGGACGALGKSVDSRVMPDGSVEIGFAIPPKQVLVVTSLEWTVQGADPSEVSQVSLGASGARFFRGGALADGAGAAAGTANFFHVIRAGTTICLTSSSDIDGLEGTLHGFLAKDR